MRNFWDRAKKTQTNVSCYDSCYICSATVVAVPLIFFTAAASEYVKLSNHFGCYIFGKLESTENALLGIIVNTIDTKEAQFYVGKRNIALMR